MPEEKAKCETCDLVFDELMTTFRVALDQMKDLAARGKGQEEEAKTNPIYNRYFGCAIAMDSLMTQFFADRLPKKKTEENTETVAVVGGEASANAVRH